MLASASVAVIATAITVALFYVRSITAASEKADRALAVAQRERDRAMLSEASLLLDKDPARAKNVLAGVTTRSPQYALTLSRATQRASRFVVPFPERTWGLIRTPRSNAMSVLTRSGHLYSVDPHVAERHLVARWVDRAVAYHAGTWLYQVRKVVNAITLANPSNEHAYNTGSLRGIAALVSLDAAVYALDTADNVYRLSDGPPVLLRAGVHRIAGDHRQLVMCLQDGTLEVLREDVVISRHRCQPKTLSPESIAVISDDYATLTETGGLITVRNGRISEIRTEIRGEYEIALSDTGLVALADYGDVNETWFVQPGSPQLEHGPKRAAELLSVTAGGDFAAWGYSDGAITVIETTTGATWELNGHANGVSHLALLPEERLLVSVSLDELRTWHLDTPPVTRVPQAHYYGLRQIQGSPDGQQIAFGGRLGDVRVWERESGKVTQVHQHAGQVIGVQWLRNKFCSISWDGTVRCSTLDGSVHEVFRPDGGRILGITAAATHDFLIFASTDGRIWKIDDQLHELYSQQSVPNAVAVDATESVVASCGVDGSVMVFDLNANRVISRTIAHDGAVRRVAWQGDTLLTAGTDGWLRRWRRTGDVLTLRDQHRAPGAFRLLIATVDGWLGTTESGTLLISAGSGPPLQLEFARLITDIDVSRDQRYLAVSTEKEIIAIDLRERRLAALRIDNKGGGALRFLDAASLIVGAAAGVTVVRVTDLDYVPF